MNEPNTRFRLITRSTATQREDFARDVATGLKSVPKWLPCRYFYDPLGSKLFEAICELPEYYLTRAETAILQQYAAEIVSAFPATTDLIELGSGSAVKTRLLLEAFSRRGTLGRYIPIDICREVLEQSAQSLLAAYPELEIEGLAAEYHDGLAYLREHDARPKLVLWLGSNIGNLDRSDAIRFLNQLAGALAPPDQVLIGFDLRKSRAVLEAAYDDACGVTAAFNRNILRRINVELGGNFDLRGFAHRATYNEQLGRIEMHLVSARPQQVRLDRLQLKVAFDAGETIHTENSYKYTPAEIDTLAAAAGLPARQQWYDAERRFCLALFGGGR